jgi:hypothetical protein
MGGKSLDDASGFRMGLDFWGTLLLALSIICTLSSYLLRDAANLLRFTFLVSGYILICLSFIIQKDPSLEKTWADVGSYNYSAGVETTVHGPFYVLDTWNSRTNPYVNDGYFVKEKALAREFIEKYNLSWLACNKWEIKDLPLEKANNRPYMHPPLAPVVIGAWLSIFPFGKWSAEIFMIVLNALSLSILLYFINKRGYTRNVHYLLFAVFANPCLILFIDPSNEQLAALLILISIFVLVKNSKNKFLLAFISGIFIGFAFYTKFITGLYMLFQALFLLFSMKKKSLKPFIGYVTGIITVMLLFSFLGYYFWLTYITGNAYAKQYIMDFPISKLKIFTDFLYFGPSILILAAVSFTAAIFKSAEVDNRTITIPLFVSILLYCILYLNVSALNRYLAVFVPAGALLIYPLTERIKLNPKSIVIAAIANYAIYCLIIYL